MSDKLAVITDYFTNSSPWTQAVVGAVAVGVPILLYVRHRRNQPRPTPIKKDWKKDMVYLYQFPAAKTIPNVSPFCLKLETWLRLSKIPFEYISTGLSLRSREGMCPFVELNGVEYSDSSLIIRDLSQHFSVDEGVAPELQAVGTAFEKMVECNTFWTYAICRYYENTELLFNAVGVKVPFVMKFFFLRAARKWIMAKLVAMGIGRHNREDIMYMGLNDLRALSAYLGTKPYLLGDKMTKADCSIFGHLGQIEYIDIPAPHRDLIDGECRNIKQYLDRIKAELWKDWEQVCRERTW